MSRSNYARAVDYDLDEALTDAARRLACAIADHAVPFSSLRPEVSRVRVEHKGRTLLVKRMA